ncbi:hypothetical protein P7K49_011368 [Saguinus oedipus]|uniref:Uncharacterized protein n=1 Tax=Saguinus oedipus TaxID=9490 RepID=A0ABQ9VTZ0_SAGOE|nr:hypothetical protein P7K49_011368 [Saguinus oedipus]
MADLTSVLTSVMFSPSSKMFIGGLSWQTSPEASVSSRSQTQQVSFHLSVSTFCTLEVLKIESRRGRSFQAEVRREREDHFFPASHQPARFTCFRENCSEWYSQTLIEHQIDPKVAFPRRAQPKVSRRINSRILALRDDCQEFQVSNSIGNELLKPGIHCSFGVSANDGNRLGK